MDAAAGELLGRRATDPTRSPGHQGYGTVAEHPQTTFLSGFSGRDGPPRLSGPDAIDAVYHLDITGLSSR
ncbi:hypothetical protein GCM10009831_09100 [Dietzia cercidiphylli]|uniref:Uncharacterized protein n=1 Tax=Dietzia cercidiphylli TaxID=498199 RepID=A0ABP4UE80_9ACTN